MSTAAAEPVELRSTVCVPTIGRASLWSRTIPSITTTPPTTTEIVIVGPAPDSIDGKKTDFVPLVVAAPAGISPGAKRNIGARHTTGDVLVFLDDDDELTPGALTALVEPFADQEVDFVSGACLAVNVQGLEIETVRPTPLGPLFGQLIGVFLAGGFAVRRSLFDEIGGYHEDLWFGENSDLAMRLGQEIQRRKRKAISLDRTVARHHRSGRAYSDVGGASAEHVLVCQAAVLDDHRSLRSSWHGTAGVWAFREGRRRDARRHFRRAIADAPTSLAAWYRFVVSLAPPLARRRWERGRP